jgi:hypothetical protein
VWSSFVRVESFNVLPRRENRKMVFTAALLEYVIAHVAFILATLFSQIFEQDLSFLCALRKDIDMRHHGYGIPS